MIHSLVGRKMISVII